jgi:hypothetical protein
MEAIVVVVGVGCPGTARAPNNELDEVQAVLAFYDKS